MPLGVIVVLAAGAGLVAGLLLLGPLVVRRSRADATSARAEAAALRKRLDELAGKVEALSTSPDPRPLRTEPEYRITSLGEETEEPRVPARIEGRLFADIVLRESVVRAASLAHGVRRALAPETRNRIRFEIKREVKRARKQRRAELRAARREWEARQRALRETGYLGGEDSAA